MRNLTTQGEGGVPDTWSAGRIRRCRLRARQGVKEKRTAKLFIGRKKAGTFRCSGAGSSKDRAAFKGKKGGRHFLLARFIGRRQNTRGWGGNWKRINEGGDAYGELLWGKKAKKEVTENTRVGVKVLDSSKRGK